VTSRYFELLLPLRQTSEKSQPAPLEARRLGRLLLNYRATNPMKYWKDFRTGSGLMALRKGVGHEVGKVYSGRPGWEVVLVVR